MRKKLASRKLWVCLAGVAMGLVTLLGLDESEMSLVAGAVTTLGSVITYILTEGRLDAAAMAREKTDEEGEAA